MPTTTSASSFFHPSLAASTRKRSAYDGGRSHISEEVTEEASEVGNNFKTVLETRQDEEPVSALSAINTSSGDDEGSAVLISYFGICASNTTTGWSCTKKRHQAETLGGSPIKFLKLAGSLQGAISPLLPIVAVTLQGSLIILSCFLGFRSSAGFHSKLGRLFLMLSFAAFSASLLTAILFQSAAGMIYSAFITSETIVVSKGTGGIALAWAGVFFTSLAMAGVIVLALLADSPQETKNHSNNNKGARGQRDIEMPAIRDTSVRRGEPHPQKVHFGPTPGHKYSEQVEDMKRGKPPFINGWNMI
ncbi:hypothetical protein Q9L58_005237 [Maublancomyces gigas]|uniref:Uncharacterized protein n=1 Tax=Discina gigas TaxID=1032678 RepID=A0ABR3GIP1_9PEZI